MERRPYFFEKKCVILREETEWVEIVEEKAAICVGADKAKMISAYQELMNSTCEFPSIFGDGKAGIKIARVLANININVQKKLTY